MATHSSILPWRIPWIGSLVGYIPYSCRELDKTEQLTLSFLIAIIFREVLELQKLFLFNVLKILLTIILHNTSIKVFLKYY